MVHFLNSIKHFEFLQMKNLGLKLFLLCFWGSGIAMAQSTELVNKETVYVGENTVVSVLGDFINSTEGDWINDGENVFKADFTNEGLVTFLVSEEAKTVFKGENLQTFRGNGQAYFKNLVLDNSSSAMPFQLETYFEIEGKVGFVNGIINNDASNGGALYFAEGASHTGAGHTKHVNGSVWTSGETEFEFPIGNEGHYGFARISEPAFSDPYEAQYFKSNSNEKYPHARKMEGIDVIDNKQFWILKAEGRGSDLVLSLPLDESITNSSLLKDPENVHIVRWDDSEGRWIDHGGDLDHDTWTVSAPVSEFGVFALATVKAEEELSCGLEVYNAITPNSDGKNDYFLISGKNGNTDCFEKIGVQIFDKWGAKVFETSDYGWARPGGVFIGQHNVDGRQKKEKLASGNYFYVLDIDYLDAKGASKTMNKTGYLYLKDE